jgi:hypothetical protein
VDNLRCSRPENRKRRHIPTSPEEGAGLKPALFTYGHKVTIYSRFPSEKQAEEPRGSAKGNKGGTTWK